MKITHGQEIARNTYSELHQNMYIMNTYLLKSLYDLSSYIDRNYVDCVESIKSKLLAEISDAIIKLKDIHNFLMVSSMLKGKLSKLFEILEKFNIGKNKSIYIVISDMMENISLMEKVYKMFKITSDSRRNYEM